MNKIICAVSLTAILAGCSNSLPPEVLALRKPSNAHAGIRNTSHQPIIGVYHHRNAVDPKPWRRSNEKQPSKQGESS